MLILGVYLRGLLIGCADLVPGVSGATLALLTGIYGRILDVLYACDRELLRLLLKGQLKKVFSRLQLPFVLPLLLGVLTSLLSLARGVKWLMVSYSVPFWAFFMGLALATAYWMLRDLPFMRRPVLLLGLCLGVGIAVGLALLPTAAVAGGSGLLLFMLSAAVAICAMLLPGISGSLVLLLLGQYEVLVQALADFDVLLLGCFGLGAVLGLLTSGRLVRLLWRRYPQPTLSLLSGLVLGSMLRLWPWRLGERFVLPAVYAESTSSPAYLGWAAVSLCLAVLLVLRLAPKTALHE